MKITNMNRDRSVDLTLPQKSGGVKVVSIRAGESDTVDIAADDPQIVALLHTQQITTGAEAVKAAAQAAKPTAS